MNTDQAPRFRPSTVEADQMPDKNYSLAYVDYRPIDGDRWISKLCAGLCAIVGVACIINATLEVLKETTTMTHLLDALLLSIVAIPPAVIAAYLLYFGVKAKIE